MDKIRAFAKSQIFLYIILALFSLAMACLSKDYDYDLYARLIVGEHFFSKGWITYQDFLSYTPTHLWYDHEWGSSLIFYAFLKLFGNFGLILVQAIAMFFTSFFILKTQQIQKHAYPTSIAFMVVFLALFSHQNPSIVRCHMFSFMLFSMLLYFLEKTRLCNSNILWLMVPITIIWNNLHGGVVSGLGIIFIYLIGAIISKKPWFKYFCVLFISLLMLLINPYGIDYLSFLVSANTKTRTYITEWWGVFSQRHVMYYYPIFCASIFTILTVFTRVIGKKRFDVTKLLLLIVTATLGIMHVKLLSLVLIVVCALYYNEIIALFDKAGIRFLNKVACVIVFFAICYIPFTNPSVARTSLTKFPVTEVEFLKQNKVEGNLVTEFGLGSYTSYKLFPQNLIYMDGRYEEVYYDREFENLMHYEKVDAQLWDIIINNYPTEILMPEINVPIYDFLKNNPDWEEVYTGKVCGIFLPKNRKNNKQKFIQPVQELEYYQKREFENMGKFKDVN